MPLTEFPRQPTETLRVARPVPTGLSSEMTPTVHIATVGWMTAGAGNPPAFAAVTAPVVCDHTTVGAIERTVRPTEPQLISRFLANESTISGSVVGKDLWYYMLVDVLNRQGGLGANTDLTQTTNLPTAALTRYTDGVGVIALIEPTVQWGNTATTITFTYTNQAGTGGKVGVCIVRDIAARISQYPNLLLASGDTGIRSIESVTLTPGTGASSSFGVMLVKPLAIFSVNAGEELTIKDIVGWNTGVHPDACLTLLSINGGSVAIRCDAQIDLTDPDPL